MMAINNVMGEAERLVSNFVAGAGFVGIAVALMGRSHPIGVFLAALLFGALYQGGAELQFEMPISREMIVVIQALVILFTGALDNMVRMPMEKPFLSLSAAARPAATARRSEAGWKRFCLYLPAFAVPTDPVCRRVVARASGGDADGPVAGAGAAHGAHRLRRHRLTEVPRSTS
jgi:hypothetical protein